MKNKLILLEKKRKQKSGMEELICIYKDTDKTRNCKNYCCGITNICGFYRNKLGSDPFYDLR